MELTVNAENYDGVGDFATNANVISAVRQALARRTAVRVEHVEVSIIQDCDARTPQNPTNPED
eukprot:5634010-Amphidinium_carterae.1